MIKLEPQPKPAQLTDEKIAELTAKYIADGNRVWNVGYIRKALLKMSHNKCCYCECRLNIEGYMPVEHFNPKSLYPEEVVEWENLLPSCERCNKAKSNHDSKKEPIIHPAKLWPKEHIYLNLKTYQLIAYTPIGQKTLDVIKLNKRLNEGIDILNLDIELQEELKSIYGQAIDYENKHINSLSKIIHRLTSLMKKGIPQSSYSAITSTILLESQLYQKIKTILENHKLWTSELMEIEKEMKYCALL